jgi:cobalamin biosynthesis protein CobT
MLFKESGGGEQKFRLKQHNISEGVRKIEDMNNNEKMFFHKNLDENKDYYSFVQSDESANTENSTNNTEVESKDLNNKETESNESESENEDKSSSENEEKVKEETKSKDIRKASVSSLPKSKVIYNVINSNLDHVLDFQEFFSLIRWYDIFNTLCGNEHTGFISRKDYDRFVGNLEVNYTLTDEEKEKLR